MAYQKAIIAQMKTPQDENGVRYDVFMKTHINAIIATDDDGNQLSFSDLLTELIDERTVEIVNNYVTEYDVFSTTSDGLVPAPSAATTTTYLRSDGNWAVPVGTTYSAFSGCSSSASGSSGLVPTPLANTTTYFLCADGTWKVPNYTVVPKMAGATTGSDGVAGIVPLPSAGTTDRYLCVDGTWQTISFPSVESEVSDVIENTYYNNLGVYVGSTAPAISALSCLWAKTE